VNKTNRKKSRTNKSPDLEVVISCPFSAQGEEVNKTNRKKSRTNKSPELEVVISCPFRAQGVGAQLPAYPAYLVSTPAALHLTMGHELVTPNHDEASRQCSHTRSVNPIRYAKKKYNK